MTLVLIVAKTRRGGQACIGGITDGGKSVRLIAADAETDDHAGMEYNVGEVWEIEARKPKTLLPPHVENLVVHSARRIRVADPAPAIARFMPPACGGPETLFDGLAQASERGRLYIAESTGIPSRSTMFWRPDRPLQRIEDGKRVRYRYPSAGDPSLVFVGFQEPVAEIPAGTLLRVSLAHWWRPEDSEAELRCYVQLSGWFAEEGTPATKAAPEETAPAATIARRVPSMEEARRTLRSVFGYDSFRPTQEEVVSSLLNGQDTLAVMPTGSGKSLCFQLPALICDGLTVVVSPLIALMQDQVEQLHALGLPAALLNSTVDYSSYVETTNAVRRGRIKLLYTSPETLLRPETLLMLDSSRVAFLVVDEAHCISQWGHDFRPEYRQLREVRERYPAAACAAFTATATDRVRQDIVSSLELRAPAISVASFNRENLYLAVQPRQDGPEQVAAFLREHAGESGIIYCSTRRETEELSQALAGAGFPALPYHAGLPNDVRATNQDAFARSDTAIMVATVAFGMGINKSNVRFVLHYNMPASIESYYQEIGRAGRDGLRADCLLLYGAADLYTHKFLIDQGAPEQRQARKVRLKAMIGYADAPGCRRELLLGYFGEALEQACDFCDNCLPAPTETAEIPGTGSQVVDATEFAALLLRCIS